MNDAPRSRLELGVPVSTRPREPFEVARPLVLLNAAALATVTAPEPAPFPLSQTVAAGAVVKVLPSAWFVENDS